MDFTEDEVADRHRRIEGRLQLREFESKHGQAKTLAMYDHLEGVNA